LFHHHFLYLTIKNDQNSQDILYKLFIKTQHLFSNVSDASSMSIIKECWARMFSSMNDWEKAYQHFFDAFGFYASIGHINTKQCLKYVVIASILSKENINPFATQAANVYKENKEIKPIYMLQNAFHENNIKEFDKILKIYNNNLFNDDFMKQYIPNIISKMRSNVLKELIKPYKYVKIEWLANKLNASNNEINNLIINLILNGLINGKIDQINGLLDLNNNLIDNKLVLSMETWINSVTNLQSVICSRADENKNFYNNRLNTFDAFDFDNDYIGFNDDLLSFGYM